MTFENVQIGDILWSIRLGACEVKEVTKSSRPILVQSLYNKSIGEISYTLDGYENENDIHPSLFWSNPKIQIPPKPKCKVKLSKDGNTQIVKIEYEVDE